MRETIVSIVEYLTCNRVRGQHNAVLPPDLRWWWTPWTYSFGYGGWIVLSPKWIAEYFRWTSKHVSKRVWIDSQNK